MASHWLCNDAFPVVQVFVTNLRLAWTGCRHPCSLLKAGGADSPQGTLHQDLVDLAAKLSASIAMQSP